MTGIYKIENLINGKIYIGQAIDIEKRWEYHKTYLRHNKHCNKYLQRAWNKYEEENFKFEVIEECSEELLNEKEIYWIDYYNALYNKSGYNLTVGGKSTFGYKHIKETRKKLSIINKKRFSNPANHHLFGKHHTEETKEKIRQNHLGKKASFETKQKQSKLHKGTIWINNGIITKMIKPDYFYIYEQQGYVKGRGKDTSDIVNRIKILQYDLEGNLIREFNSISDATKSLNKVGSLIGECVRGNRKTAYGYIWKRSAN